MAPRDRRHTEQLGHREALGRRHHPVDRERMPRRIDRRDPVVMALVMQAGWRQGAQRGSQRRQAPGGVARRIGRQLAHGGLELRTRTIAAVVTRRASLLPRGVGRDIVVHRAGRRALSRRGPRQQRQRREGRAGGEKEASATGIVARKHAFGTRTGFCRAIGRQAPARIFMVHRLNLTLNASTDQRTVFQLSIARRRACGAWRPSGRRTASSRGGSRLAARRNP